MAEAALIVFPPEPPVAMTGRPERRTAGKGAPLFGAAERTLAGEHRSGIPHTNDGRRSGNTIRVIPAGELRAFFLPASATARAARRQPGKNRDSQGERNRRVSFPLGSLPLDYAAGTSSRRCSFNCSFSTSMFKYRVASTQSSWISTASARIKRKQLSALGKIRTTSVRRLSS